MLKLIEAFVILAVVTSSGCIQPFRNNRTIEDLNAKVAHLEAVNADQEEVIRLYEHLLAEPFEKSDKR